MSRRLYIPGYNNNAVIQLIISSGVAFVLLNMVKVILMILDFTPGDIDHYIFSNISLPGVQHYASKFWTIITYGWFHKGFWELLTNMIWLYAFGSVVQMLIGYRQVIPLFIYSIAMGGVFFLLSQLIPGNAFSVNGYLIGAQAGIIGLAAAALTISPKYRFYLAEHFSVPLGVIVAIFAALMIMNTNLHPALLLLLLGGAGMGALYVVLLRNGYKLGDWMYNMFDAGNHYFSPDEHAISEKRAKKRSKVLSNTPQPRSQQKRVDDILDKINQKGYNSLTTEEKEILMRAGKDTE